MSRHHTNDHLDATTLLARINAQFSPEHEASLANFVATLWLTWPHHEMQDRDDDEQAAIVYGLWLSYQKALHDASEHSSLNALTIKMPSVEEEGWACHRTIFQWAIADKPFVVDTLRLIFNNLGINTHIITSAVISHKQQAMAVIYAELGLLTEDEIATLETTIGEAFGQLDAAVSDYQAIIKKVSALADELGDQSAVHREAANLLLWLEKSHFTYIGFRKLPVNGKPATEKLGVFRNHIKFSDDELVSVHCEGAACEEPIIFTKWPELARIHRGVYPDCIVVNCYKDGELYATAHILGFFTYAVSQASPESIPWVRRKIKQVFKNAAIPDGTNAKRTLQRVIEGFPRDELFQASTDELTHHLLGVCQINERKQVRLYLRTNPFGRFATALVYVPRDVYSTRVRIRIEQILSQALASEAVEATTFFSESVLARAYCVFKLPKVFDRHCINELDIDQLQHQIAEITTGWLERLEVSLVEAKGDKCGLPLYRQYANVFSMAYQEAYDAREAILDIDLFEKARSENVIATRVFKPLAAKPEQLRFKVVNAEQSIALSDVIPILENLGARVIGENPYALKDGGTTIWLHDFKLELSAAVEADSEFKQRFSEAFLATWRHQCDNDSFNKLITAGQFYWRDIIIFRAFAAHFKQTLFTLDSEAIAQALLRNLNICHLILQCFYCKFDPSQDHTVAERLQAQEAFNDQLLSALENVASLDDDRVLRRYAEVLQATLRTNFFQHTGERACNEVVAFKFAPKQMPSLPAPRPEYEIFVYSPRVEGVHLRTSKVARGGLRWSDRNSDFRTEVLGLVKAQAVKNAVIVPSGAKGGFVAKRLANFNDRASQQQEGIACYQLFIRALLALTDNLVDGVIRKPDCVVCFDEDDPYLVVAADKGTATFSDIANAISLEVGHWLGDAFASGGSQGYDHKAMGITAKGGWISVQRHFREVGIDVQSSPISVIGIGDMAGDVFGNGMLLSEQIKLTAAFNHLHIFIDPNPDVATSFAERQRLFETAGSNWGDYDRSLISEGGGVFLRSAKRIAITPAMKERFAIEADYLAPTEFIHCLLQAPVDLIWNGGIGTYVKGSDESHQQVGDKANDSLRVNGNELRCKVFGEGGNLGMTQKGRIEFCLAGGACNTDFIDNAAGVDCSDHEVNLKILLQDIMAKGDLTEKQRNQILRENTEAVADCVLGNNISQTECLSMAERQAVKRTNEYRKFIHYLETHAQLNRALEFIPNDEALSQRNDNGKSLTRPELAVLLSYAKVQLKGALSALPELDEPIFLPLARRAFPPAIAERFSNEINEHRLRREIIATELANDFVNQLGITAAYRFMSTGGVSLAQVMQAYVAAREVFCLGEFHQYLTTKFNVIAEDELYELKAKMSRRVRRGVRWFLRNQSDLSTPVDVSDFNSELKAIASCAEEVLAGQLKQEHQQALQHYQELGLNDHWCKILAVPDNLFAGLGVIAIAQTTQATTAVCTGIFYGLHSRLRIRNFASAVSEMSVSSPWQAIARESLLEDIEIQLRGLAETLVHHYNGSNKAIGEFLDEWLPVEPLESWLDWLANLEAERQAEKGAADIALYQVTLRQLMQCAKQCQSHWDALE